LYRRLRFGDLAEFNALGTRQYRGTVIIFEKSYSKAQTSDLTLSLNQHGCLPRRTW
jgi:phosphodiesterase/alkaline phosphatase D-like protein